MEHNIYQLVFYFSAIMEFENSIGIMFRGSQMDNCDIIQCGGDDTFVSQGEDKVYRGQWNLIIFELNMFIVCSATLKK